MPKKRVSSGRLFYYIIGLLETLSGGWLCVDPTRDDVLPLTDVRVGVGKTEDATQEEIDRYIDVMTARRDWKKKKNDEE